MSLARYHTIGTGASNINEPVSATASSLMIVDRLLEPQTVAHFFEFLTRGEYPSGRPPRPAPLEGKECMQLFMHPAVEWAPAPWNADPAKPPLVQEIMTRIGSHEDITGLLAVDKPIHASKSRVWEGIAPMSSARWAERRLDDPDNHAAAVQHISHVVQTFAYLATQEPQQKLRAVYNNIYTCIKDVNPPFNAARRARGKNEDIDVAALWYDFMSDLLFSMAERAYRWVDGHAAHLTKQAITMLGAHDPDTQAHPAPPPYDAVQWLLTNRMHDLLEISVQADVIMMIPLDGYLGHSAAVYGPSEEQQLRAELRNPDKDERMASFSRNLKQMSRMDQLAFMTGFMVPMNRPESIIETYENQQAARQHLKRLLRGDEAARDLGPEPWLRSIELTQQDDETDQKEDGQEEEDEEGEGKKQGEAENTEKTRPYPHWGFVAYRLTHGQGEEEWDDFLNGVASNALSWVDGTHGADRLEHSFELRWLDGADLDIADGDVEAAKRHFSDYVEADDTQHMFQSSYRLAGDTFLIADGDAYKSFLNSRASRGGASPSTSAATASDAPPQSKPLAPGNTGLALLAVDASFDPSAPPDEHADESPGYPGQLRVLASVLIGDVYSMQAAQTQGLQEFWPLAMRHPQKLYIGPVSRSDEESW